MVLINVSKLIPRSLVIGCLTTVGVIGQSAEPSPLDEWWHGDSVSGQWGGFRERAETRGATFFAEFTADNLWNTTGGMKTGHAYLSLLEFGLELDLETLTDWWKGGSFKASGIYVNNTHGITTALVGDLNGVSGIEAPEGARLYEFWLAQTLLNDSITLQVGNMLADSYFASNETAAFLLNGSFGWSQFIAANTGTIVPAYPFAALGGRAAWRPTEQLEIQAAVFDGNSLDNAANEIQGNPNGFEFRLNNELFFISEIDWKRNHEEGTDGLRGTYSFGGFYSLQAIDDLYEDVNGNPWIVTGNDPRSYDGTFGLYVAVDQEIYREREYEGLSFFARVASLPSDRDLVDLVLDTGLTYLGAIPGRDRDIASAGFIFSRISENQTRTEEVDNEINGVPYGAFSDHEMVFEITYQAWINNWWFIQPDVQYVVHPGGSAVLENALIAGVRTGLSF